MAYSSSRFALWQLAFRPFFLFGALYALLAMALWVLILAGGSAGTGALPPVSWHSHEMIYGFSGAIIGGFILTAVQNWTGIRGVRGAKLAAIFVIWALPRVFLLTFAEPQIWVSALDLAFYPTVAACMIPYLRDPEMKTERVFYLFFALFFAGNLLVHLDAFGVLPGRAADGIRLGLNVIVLMIVFIGGRVIPFFTESERSRRQPVTREKIEWASHASSLIFLVAATFWRFSVPAAMAGFFAAGIHLTRLAGWQVPRVRRVPLLWILHFGYLWIVLGYLLSGLTSLGLLPGSSAVHAFAVGGIGVVIYGMISRVSLGHTGRRLRPSFWTVLGFVLILLASASRVIASIPGHGLYQSLLIFSGFSWIGGFALFVINYMPILFRPRLDGQDG